MRREIDSGLGVRELARVMAAQWRLDESRKKIPEPDILVGMKTNRQFLAGGVNGAAQFQARGIDAEIHIGHEYAQEENAIALLDVAAHLLAPHRPFIDAEIKRMLFADDRFAEDGGCNGNAGALGQAQQHLLQAKAVHLDIGQDDRHTCDTACAGFASSKLERSEDRIPPVALSNISAMDRAFQIRLPTSPS